jgi:hypothetical protein
MLGNFLRLRSRRVLAATAVVLLSYQVWLAQGYMKRGPIAHLLKLFRNPSKQPLMMAPTAFDPLTTTASELQALFSQNKLTIADALEVYLAQVEKYNDYLHAVIELAPLAKLRDQAKALDKERQSGASYGPLHGIPVLIKVRAVEKVLCVTNLQGQYRNCAISRNAHYCWLLGPGRVKAGEKRRLG